MASSYMNERLPEQLDQILRIAAAHSDEILEAAYDWSLSTDDDLRSMVLQVIDCLDSRSTSVQLSRSPPSPASSPQSPCSSPTSTTTGLSSSPSLPGSSNSPPPQLCQVNHKPPEVTQTMSDGGLDGRHVRGPGGGGVDTRLRPGVGDSGAGLQLLHPPFLGNHCQAGVGGLSRKALSQDNPVLDILSEKEGCKNQTRTQGIQSEAALSLEVPEVQPPSPTPRSTSSLSNLPHRRQLMPALVQTFLRRPKRIQRPRLLRTRPCTPLTIVKICKKGKPFISLSTSCLKLTNADKLRRRRQRALTRPGLTCCRCLHGPHSPPAPPWDDRCSPLSCCTNHRTQASLGTSKPVRQSQARTPPGHHLGSHVLPSNQIRLNQFPAFSRDDDNGLSQPRKWPFAPFSSRLSQPRKWPFVPFSSRPFPPNPGVNRRCSTCSWPLSPSHPGLPHAGQFHLPHDPGGLDDPAPDDLIPCRDLHHNVLVLHSQHREFHDAPDPVQASPGVPSVPVTISLVRGSSKDDLSPVTPPQQPTCLASSGRASDPCGRRHLESRPWKVTILKRRAFQDRLPEEEHCQ